VLKLTGVSPNIDSCAGLIAQKSSQAHYKIASYHKRWIDVEDLAQEALLTAWLAEKEWDKNKGAKYSSYLFQGLVWWAAHCHTLLSQQKQTIRGIVEIDAPVGNDPDGSLKYEVPDTSVCVEGELECIKAFITLCRAVSERAVVVLVRGLLFSDLRKSTPELCQEIGRAAAQLRIGVQDLRVVFQSEKIRKKVLTLVSKDVRMSMGTEESLRVLECVECRGTFSIAAIREGRYFASTMTCRACHRKMLQSAESCFGKEYSETDLACQLHCPDRVVCKEFKKGDVMVDKEAADLDDVDFSDVKEDEEKAAPKEASKGKGKSKKEPKAAKKAKEPKEEEEAPPKEVGPRWPFKSGSMMRYCFQMAFEGVKVEALKAEVEKAGYSWAKQLKALRKGGPRNPRIAVTHTWKLNEEGGRLKIYDLKYVGSKIMEAPKGKTKAEGKGKKAVAKGKGKKAA
jgi:sigma-70-like protein